jgi:N-acetylmuramoyl-L-alanine amidase
MNRAFTLLLFLFFTSFVYAQSDSTLLKRANSYAKSSSKTEQFRAYNAYKNLYLRAMVDENSRLKRAALRGIVSSGHKLHIDVSRYSQELHTLQRVTPKRVKKQKRAPQKRLSKTSLQSVRWQDERLFLHFNRALRSSDVNHFRMYDAKKRIYKYIFDIHAVMRGTRIMHKKGIDTIRVAQHNASTIRLVIQNRKPLEIHFTRDASKLSISMDHTKRKKPLVVSKTKRTVKAPIYTSFRHKIIVIDAGHGGKDPGATGYKNYHEKDVVLKIAQNLKKILRSRGYKVYMTRDSDVFIKLRNRTKFANNRHADLFISIHANAVRKKDASNVHGIESYFLATSRSKRAKRVAAMENSADLEDMNFYGKQCFLNTLNYHNIIASNKLAIDLQRGALSQLQSHYANVEDAGVREGPFWVLVGAQMPSVLVEVGFITNPMEAERLMDKKYQYRVALGLANGVEHYFMNN